MPVWEQTTGLPEEWRVKHLDMADGDEVNQSHLSLDAHTGTHVDAAVHFVNEAYEYGGTIDNLDINTLIGPALVVRVPPGSNITSQVLEELQLPEDTQRLLFITDNTDKQLLSQRAFDSSYTSISASGARYLADKTQVALVGIDYLSIGMYDEIGDAHRALLGKGIIAVEGLNMTGVEPGAYHLTCLPAKLGGSDGAPIRCLIQEQNCVKVA